MAENERNSANTGEKGGKDKKKLRILLRTFGCQMNSRDSEFIMGLFLDNGYKLCNSPSEADVILFNTCSVRSHAEERAINNMAILLKTKSKNAKVFGIIGCMAQAMGEMLFKRLPGLDIICGPGDIAKLPELVKKAKEQKVISISNVNENLPEINPTYRQDTKHAYVSIMRGCNNFCSYCVVPYVRGKERSRKPEDIINEVKMLIQKGIKKITLLGQNVNSYKNSNYNFIRLLEDISKVRGLEEIRFLTSHPKDANIELFKTMRNLNKVVKHLHLPLQSGSDRILKLMRRGYTKNAYLKLVKDARSIMPDLRLTTDVIVGFPTENEEDFKETQNLMKNVGFDLVYIFKYSPRPGTKAATLKDDVEENVKKRRHGILLNLQKEISKRKKYEKNDYLCRA